MGVKLDPQFKDTDRFKKKRKGCEFLRKEHQGIRSVGELCVLDALKLSLRTGATPLRPLFRTAAVC
jgi:hypothetical protein